MGISAFVLHYSVAPARHPQPYHDVRRAIQWVRAHAEEFNIDPNRIGVLGFSAGGHLAGSAATMWEDPELAIGDELDSVSARPDLAVMCYPVVTANPETCHEGSVVNLMGDTPDRDAFSIEKRVSENTPPVFLWHTVADATVPVDNAFLMAQALGKAGVEYELHVFPEGDQGKVAITHYRVIERLGYVNLVECKLETGRTHQIRVHFQYISHPLFNDPEYGGNRILKGPTFTKYKQCVQNCFELIPGQALHARTLGFQHPTTGKDMIFEASLPDGFQHMLEKWHTYIQGRTENET